MKIRYIALVAVVVTAFVQSGCQSPLAAISDSVKILQIQSARIPRSEFTSYKVKVHYDLVSKQKGKVMLGFDSEEPGAYKMLSDVSINRGSGEVELMADVKDQNRSVITAYVNLSEYPHPSPWTPLANDTLQVRVIR